MAGRRNRPVREVVQVDDEARDGILGVVKPSQLVGEKGFGVFGSIRDFNGQ